MSKKNSRASLKGGPTGQAQIGKLGKMRPQSTKGLKGNFISNSYRNIDPQVSMKNIGINLNHQSSVNLLS